VSGLTHLNAGVNVRRTAPAVRTARDHRHDPPPPPCPHCGADLVEAPAGKAVALVCPECTGVRPGNGRMFRVDLRPAGGPAFPLFPLAVTARTAAEVRRDSAVLAAFLGMEVVSVRELRDAADVAATLAEVEQLLAARREGTR
jgi:hypothetical protein